jgi:hypothetical protein
LTPMHTTKVPIQLELSEAALARVNTPNSVSLWNGIAPHRLSIGEVNIQSRWIVIVPTPKEYRHQAEECLALAGEATELYAKAALLELAAEFREKAEGLEHYGAWHEA